MTSQRTRLGRGDRAHERGAVLTLVTLAVPVLVLMTSFAVDLGQQRALRRDLQADADVIALDLVRLADGRTRAEIESAPDFLSYVNLSFQNNGVDPVGTLAETADMVVYGTWNPLTKGPFIPALSDGIPNAVELTFEGSVDYLFRPGKGDVTRSAVAIREGEATFSIGSRLASLDTADSVILSGIFDLLFNGLPPIGGVSSSEAVVFGAAEGPAAAAAPAQESSGVSLDALSYQGLVGSDIVINELLGFINADLADAGADVGSPSQVLESDIALVSVVRGTADALAASGGGAEVDAAVAFLDQLALNMDPDLTVSLGDVLGIDVSQPGSVLDLATNVFDLLMLSAQAANEDNLVGTQLALPPGLFDGIPGLQDVIDPTATIALHVIEGPQLGSGVPNDPSAFAETSQIELAVRLGVDLQVDLAGIPGLSMGELASISLDLPLTVTVGSARADLVGMVCPTGPAAGSLDLDTTTSAATARLGTGEIASIKLFGRDVATASTGAGAVAGINVGSSAVHPVYGLPIGETDSVDAGQLGLDNLVTLHPLDIDLIPGSLLGSIFNPITDAVLGPIVSTLASAVVTPILVALDDLVVAPLVALLGMGVAGADVTAIDALCNSPKLTE